MNLIKKPLCILYLLFITLSCAEIIEPDPLELNNGFTEPGPLTDVITFTTLELSDNTAVVSWVVDSSRFTEFNLANITGIRITYGYPIRPPRDVPFASGSITHALRVDESEHCFSAFAYRDNQQNNVRISTMICGNN
ncbi:MAG: hypothetical protein AAF597_12090 [Bacteroidota bacterium]